MIRKVFHMKTTLVIDDRIMSQLKAEAARRGTTISELVEAALRLLLRKTSHEKDLPPLPTFKMGRALVNVSDREKLYGAMEGR